MTDFIGANLPYLLGGISVGGQYALIAVGYTMVYGILRLINFAHGDIFTAAGFFMVYMSAALPLYLSLPLTVILTVLVGFLVERAAYKPLRDAPRTSLLISSIGVSYLLENLAVVVFSGIPKQFPEIPLFQDILQIGTVRIARLVIIVPLLTAAIVAGMLFLLNKTKTGMAMRAVSRDYETARLMGININRIITITFCIGSMLAAVGAMMWGLKYPKIEPYVGIMPGLKCFIAAVIGGIGNVKGAVVGALLLGFIEIMIVLFFPSLSGYKDAFAFIMLIVILLVRPTGLLGDKSTNKV